MNDPGLDEPIADHAEDVENIERAEEEADEEEENDYLEPAYVSSLFCVFYCYYFRFRFVGAGPVMGCATAF